MDPTSSTLKTVSTAPMHNAYTKKLKPFEDHLPSPISAHHNQSTVVPGTRYLSSHSQSTSVVLGTRYVSAVLGPAISAPTASPPQWHSGHAIFCAHSQSTSVVLGTRYVSAHGQSTSVVLGTRYFSAHSQSTSVVLGTRYLSHTSPP
jgi:hypothetical protein